MKLIKYTLAFLIVQLLFSCSLKEEPYGFLNEDNFFQTANDAQSGILYAYSVLPEMNYYSRYFYYVAHCATEEFTQKSDAELGQHELDGYATTNQTKDLREVFQSCYIGINRTFPIIEKVPGISMNPELRNHIVGEAHFLRALNYYNLVRLFGKVPLRKVPMSDFKLVGEPLSPIKDIYDYIIEDLKKAESLMDNGKRRGRANKAAAQGLLANVYLFLASASESGMEGYNFANASYYDQAKEFAGKVVNGSDFGLDNNLFNIFDPNKENSSELIFYSIASRTIVGSLNLMSLLSTPYVSPYFELPANQGGYKMGFGWSHLWVELPFYNSYSDDDQRKKILFAASYKTESGDEKKYPDGGLTRPFTVKYLDPDRNGGEDKGNRIPIVRYSEVLLTYAEACGLNAEGMGALNKVRKRAGLNEYTVANFPSVKEFRSAVIQERSWELAYEFQRLFDLRRTGKMQEVLNGKYGKNLKQNTYFFPIPFEENDRNPALGGN